MRFILTTIEYDPDGVVDIEKLDAASEGLEDRTRRTTVTKTLDGGVVSEDGGFAHGDRAFTVRMRVNSAQSAKLKYLLETYPKLRVSLTEGVFIVAPAILTYKGSYVTFRLNVLESEALYG